MVNLNQNFLLRFNFIFLIILKIVLSNTTTANSSSNSTNLIDNERNYTNIPGVQIYLFENNEVFSYISINSTITDELHADLYLFTRLEKENYTDHGLWTAIGLGGYKMIDADMMICGFDKKIANMWCKDYVGLHGLIKGVESLVYSVEGSVIDLEDSNLKEGENWGYYKTKFTWSLKRKLNSNSNYLLADVFNGQTEAISAWGWVDKDGVPDKHVVSYNYIVTGDGNQKADLNTSIIGVRIIYLFILFMLIVYS